MQQLEEFFHEAVGPTEGACRFITQDSNFKSGFCSRIGGLVAAHERPEGLIDSPAYEVHVESIADEQPALLVGQIVGHYQSLLPS